VKTPAEEPSESEAPSIVVAGPEPPEKASALERMPGAFPDERPMIQRVGDPLTNGHVQPATRV
jgi:hypothetical protein